MVGDTYIYISINRNILRQRPTYLNQPPLESNFSLPRGQPTSAICKVFIYIRQYMRIQDTM